MLLRGGYCGALVCLAAWGATGCESGSVDDAPFAASPQPTRLRITMLDAEREARTVFDYDVGDRPRARITLAPPLANRTLTFSLQGKSGGTWVDARSENVLTGAGGKRTVALPRLGVGAFRVGAHYIGDANYAGATSDWVYFRIDPP